MPSFIEGLGQGAAAQVASQGINTGMGLLLEKHNDKRQIRQQGKLNNLQFDLDNKMKEADYDRAMRMWEATNYTAQGKELEKAGLNKGLLYGMIGGGGTTVGNTGTGVNAEAAAAPTPTGGGMGMMNATLAAQIDVMHSEAEKNRAEAEATKGYKKELAGAETQSLLQGVENQKAQKLLTETQTRLAAAAAKIQEGSIEDQIMAINAEMSKAQAQATILETQNMLDKATWEQKVQLLKEQTANTAVDTYLKGAQAALAKKGVEVSDQTIKNMQFEISTWKFEDLKDLDKIAIAKKLADIAGNENMRDQEMQGVKEITSVVGDILWGIFHYTPGQKPNKIGFK